MNSVRDLLLMAGVMVGAVACSTSEPAPKPTPEPVMEEVAEVAPTPEPETVADEQKSDLDAMKKQLLGLNKPAPKAEPAPEPKRVRRRVRRVSRPLEADLAEMEDATPQTLSDYDFQQTIGSWRGIKNCIALASDRTEKKSGALRVKLEINSYGKVVKSEVVESKSAPLSRCVARGAKRLQFPAFAAADTVTKQAKFVF